MDVDDARSISRARIIYEKNVCSVIFLSLDNLSWSALRDGDNWDSGFCGCNDGDDSCDDGGCSCDDGCDDGCESDNGDCSVCISSRGNSCRHCSSRC